MLISYQNVFLQHWTGIAEWLWSALYIYRCMQVINPTQMHTRTLVHHLEVLIATVCLKTTKNVRLLHANGCWISKLVTRFCRKVLHRLSTEIVHQFDKMELRNAWFSRIAMVVILAKQVVAVMCLRVGTPQPVRGWWSLSVAFLQSQRFVRLAIFCAGPFICWQNMPEPIPMLQTLDWCGFA